MTTVIVHLLPLSQITKIPDSQTLFGSICAQYKQVHGEAALVEMLEHAAAGNPDFLVSSMFYHQLLPMPIDVSPTVSDSQLDSDFTIGIHKKRKKIKWISHQVFEDYLADRNQFNAFFYQKIHDNSYRISKSGSILMKAEEAKLDTYDSLEKKVLLVRNKTGETVDEKQLFYTPSIYMKKDSLMDVFVSYSNPEVGKKLEAVFHSMDRISIGGLRSVGYNLFSFQGMTPWGLKNTSGTKMLVSKMLCHHQVDYSQAMYKIIWLNNKYNNNGGEGSPYKHQAIAFIEGSVFPQTMTFMGECHKDPGILHPVYTNLMGLFL